jgi:hypothetical protein
MAASWQILLDHRPKCLIVNPITVSDHWPHYISKIRNHVANRNTEIFCISSPCSDKELSTAFLCGASYYEFKPVSTEQVCTILQQHFNYSLGIQATPFATVDVRQEATTMLPGRVNWITPQAINCETNLESEPGEVLHFEGPLTREFRKNNLEITTQGSTTEPMYYNYNRSVRFSFRHSEEFRSEQIAEWINIHKGESHAKRIRVLLISTNPDLIKGVNSLQKAWPFSIRFSDNISTLERDIEFHQPQSVIIDQDSILLKQAALEKLIENWQVPKFPLIIASAELKEPETVPKRVFLVSETLTSKMVGKFGFTLRKEESNLKHWESTTPEGAHIFNKTSNLSRMWLRIPGQLLDVNERGGSIGADIAFAPPGKAQLFSDFFANFGLKSIWVRFSSSSKSSGSELLFTSKFEFLGLTETQRDEIRKYIFDNQLESRRQKNAPEDAIKKMEIAGEIRTLKESLKKDMDRVRARAGELREAIDVHFSECETKRSQEVSSFIESLSTHLSRLTLSRKKQGDALESLAEDTRKFTNQPESGTSNEDGLVKKLVDMRQSWTGEVKSLESAWLKEESESRAILADTVSTFETEQLAHLQKAFDQQKEVLENSLEQDKTEDGA